MKRLLFIPLAMSLATAALLSATPALAEESSDIDATLSYLSALADDDAPTGDDTTASDNEAGDNETGDNENGDDNSSEPEVLPGYQSPFRQWSNTGRTDPRYFNSGPCGYFDRYPSNVAVRFGWWYADNDGNNLKTGEWQSLKSSPFYNVDGLATDANHTLNYYITGTDQETNQLGLDFYAPGVKAEFDYQRFIHRLDHDPFNNFTNEADRVNTTVTPALVNDLNVGEDYAIRVEQLKAEAATYLTNNLKFKVRFWQMHKFGERQANAMAHCFSVGGPGAGNYCHVTSQRQRIDWLTTEITPTLEWQQGPLTVEYSRPMRYFNQNDQVVMRDFTNPFGSSELFPPPGSNFANPEVAPYALVPENYTQIDQLRMRAQLADGLEFYGFTYYGQTQNKNRNVDRNFGGYDLRITDYSLDHLTVTGYAKLYTQHGDRPDMLLADETRNFTTQEAEDHIRNPVEYRRNTAGVQTRVRPDFISPYFQRINWVSGYRYQSLARKNATWSSDAAYFTQSNTITNEIFTGLQFQWNPALSTYTRYRLQFVDSPLYGFRETNGALNSSLPEQQHIVQVGGVWSPTYNFNFTAHMDAVTARHYADISQVPGNIVDFDQHSYPVTLTAWWAPTCKLSMTGGAAFMSNWIDQNIILGDDYVENPAMPNPLLNPVTSRWNYGGRTTMINYNVNYAWRPNIRLTGGYQWMRSENGFNDPGYIGVDSMSNPVFIDPNLGQYSKVIVETQRLTAGADWKPEPRSPLSVYVRYIMFDYEDKTQSYNSGLAHMALAGFTVVR